MVTWNFNSENKKGNNGNTRWNQTKSEILNRKETLAGQCVGGNLDEGAQNLQSVSGGGDAVSLPVSPDEGDFVRKVNWGVILVIWMLMLTFDALFSVWQPAWSYSGPNAKKSTCVKNGNI